MKINKSFTTFIPRNLLIIADDETIVELQITFIKNTDPSGLLPNSWRTGRKLIIWAVTNGKRIDFRFRWCHC